MENTPSSRSGSQTWASVRAGSDMDDWATLQRVWVNNSGKGLRNISPHTFPVVLPKHQVWVGGEKRWKGWVGCVAFNPSPHLAPSISLFSTHPSSWDQGWHLQNTFPRYFCWCYLLLWMHSSTPIFLNVKYTWLLPLCLVKLVFFEAAKHVSATQIFDYLIRCLIIWSDYSCHHFKKLSWRVKQDEVKCFAQVKGNPKLNQCCICCSPISFELFHAEHHWERKVFYLFALFFVFTFYIFIIGLST